MNILKSPQCTLWPAQASELFDVLENAGNRRFRLGNLLPEPKGAGLRLVVWPIDRMVRVSLRTVVLDVPPQDVITRDNVSIKVSAVIYSTTLGTMKKWSLVFGALASTRSGSERWPGGPWNPSIAVSISRTSRGSSPNDSYVRPQRSSRATQMHGAKAHWGPVVRD